ncbi:hypothetical protein ACW7G4_27545 [Bacillus cereus]
MIQNSKTLHLFQMIRRRLFYTAFFSLVMSYIAKFLFTSSSLIDLFFILVFLLTFTVALAIKVYTSVAVHKWFMSGIKLSEHIGLQKLLLIPSTYYGKKVIEVHLKPLDLSDGFENFSKEKKEIMGLLYVELEDDFKKIAEWSNGEPLVTTTHLSLMNIWKKTSRNHFLIEPIDLYDPYVKMGNLEWVVASFSLTGKPSFKVPNKWYSYEFKRNEELICEKSSC